MTTNPAPLRMTSSSGVEVDVLLADQGHCDSMVVLMPAALPPMRADRLRPIFSRWKWAEEWPNSTVLAVADPSMRKAPELNGAWYIDPEADVIRAIADIAVQLATVRGISRERIVFYGSSLGGYGALMAASAARASAVAEVPQIAFKNWLPSAVAAVEKHILDGEPLADYTKKHAEQVHVWSRFVYEKHIPDFVILTNEKDRSYPDCLKVIGSLRKSALRRAGGTSDVVVMSETEGHVVLPRTQGAARVRAMLSSRSS